jgi:hypothetical protein
MHIPSFPANVLTSAASQVLTGAANRASSAVKNLASDLGSSSASGPQSFLSTLQQKLSPGSPSAAGSVLSAQIGQLSNDLKSGNVTAAKADYTQLQKVVSQLKAAQTSTTGSQAGGGDDSSASLAAMNLLQQSAYSSALNLSMPASIPSLSVSF